MFVPKMQNLGLKTFHIGRAKFKLKEQWNFRPPRISSVGYLNFLLEFRRKFAVSVRKLQLSSSSVFDSRCS